jgi:hypothetical protein
MAETPIVKRVKNGWHAESATLNLAVRGDTPESAKRLFAQAIEKAAELRDRPAHFANPS